jgi:two-component system nitrogen regulation sensor histidine kinase GlnL
MLIQAVLNIVRNAQQAMGSQGTILLRTRAQRQVTIGHRRFKLVVSINIIDNGPGIAPDMLENIFYPMVTGRANGTGLGLSIAQSLVNQHNGLIECASRPGHTVFTLMLPLDSTDD